MEHQSLTLQILSEQQSALTSWQVIHLIEMITYLLQGSFVFHVILPLPSDLSLGKWIPFYPIGSLLSIKSSKCHFDLTLVNGCQSMRYYLQTCYKRVFQRNCQKRTNSTGKVHCWCFHKERYDLTMKAWQDSLRSILNKTTQYFLRLIFLNEKTCYSCYRYRKATICGIHLQVFFSVVPTTFFSLQHLNIS